MKNPKLIWGSSAVLGGLAYLKIWLPLTNIGIPCPFYKVTGHFCPGCGITRAISALLKGDFQLAWQYNVLVYVVPVVFAAYFGLNHFKLRKQAEIMLYVIIALVLVFALLRNFPAFSYLAPLDDNIIGNQSTIFTST